MQCVCSNLLSTLNVRLFLSNGGVLRERNQHIKSTSIYDNNIVYVVFSLQDQQQQDLLKTNSKKVAFYDLDGGPSTYVPIQMHVIDQIERLPNLFSNIPFHNEQCANCHSCLQDVVRVPYKLWTNANLAQIGIHFKKKKNSLRLPKSFKAYFGHFLNFSHTFYILHREHSVYPIIALVSSKSS